MNTSHCTHSNGVLPGARRRVLSVAQWIAPGVTLALLPKCPACIAGYVALWTGVGLSLSAASGLRYALFVVCAGTLLFLVGRQLRRLILRRNAPNL